MKRHYLFHSLLAALIIGVLMSSSALAITYSFLRQANSTENLLTGTVVVMATDNSTVRAAGQADGQAVMGAVAATPKGSLQTDRVAVVSSGVVSVLVSDINGLVKKGDPVAVSPLNGVAMKATQAGWIVGTVQEDFAASTDPAVKTTVATRDGTRQPVVIKHLPVLLSVSHYSPGNTGASGFLGPALSAAESIAGHTVSTTRAVVALLVFAGAIILLVALVYSAVKNSLTAIGRNPLASTKISAGLVKILATAVGVIVITLVVIYMILR